MFSLSSSQFLLSYTLIFSCAVFPTENTTVCLVFLRKDLFFWQRQNMAPSFWQHTHFGTFPAGTFLFLLHELRAACSEEQEQWAAVPSPPLRGSWFCTAHTLFAVCKAWGGAATFPRSQILLTGTLRGKTVGEGKQTWRTHSQMTFNCSNYSPVLLMYPLSSECLEILHWNDELFGESVHLTEQYLWQGEEPKGRQRYVFVILTKSGNTQLRKRL